MKRFLFAIACLSLPATAQADAYEQCEIVIMEDMVDEDGGTMAIASFRPADGFLESVQDPDVPVTTMDGTYDIRALMCTRNDLIPTEDDYAVLATGVPLAISQNFDSTDSDSLTIFFRDGTFDHKYASAYPMSEEFEALLTERLIDFSARDHGLGHGDEASKVDSDADSVETETSDNEMDADAATE